MFKSVSKLALEKAKASKMLTNLSSVSEEQIREIYDKFGEEGLFKLHLLATTHESGEFNHFFEYITGELLYGNLHDPASERPLELDNGALQSAPELNDFNHNVVNSRLSRQLYNPGGLAGCVVHGLGGPRILVSLPFVGASHYLYDVYNNSIDVVTSLNLEGYFGTFLLLDFADGLNVEYFGQPGWLLWFSIIAAHSDLVIFVKQEGTSLTDAQKCEIAFTPDRVGKKVVSLKLSWAKKHDFDPSTVTVYLTGKGVVSQQEAEQASRETAEPFVHGYRRDVFPKVDSTAQRIIE
jgi:hypothetical protein